MNVPKLSIGLPVYNGENYLEDAVTSLLAQTFGDFELILSDNASTDRTRDICLAFADADPRVRYHRFDRNMGAATNFNHVFTMARGRYFKWAAHDDVCEPAYLERCIEVLDSDDSVVLCHARSGRIDAEGNEVGVYDYPVRYDAPKTADRFLDLVTVRHDCITVFGVIRPEVLVKTPLIGSYVASDRVLLAELALHGRLMEIPEILFHRRDHVQVSSMLDERNDRLAWFDPHKSGVVSLPNWRVIREYVAALGRAPMNPDDAFACWRCLPAHIRSRDRHLKKDLKEASKMLLNRSALGRKVMRGIQNGKADPAVRGQ